MAVGDWTRRFLGTMIQAHQMGQHRRRLQRTLCQRGIGGRS